MTPVDWSLVAVYFGATLSIGLRFARRAGKSIDDYFVSGRNLPWWVLGVSAVSTYTDAGLAPAATMLAFQDGLLGNAVWWIPYAVWMPLSAVLWAKYWRRLRVITSAELLETRYSGRAAKVYRGVYAALMSFGFVVVLMAYVSSWLSAALGPILGWDPVRLLLAAAAITAVYTVSSGLYGVAYTDVCQFAIFLAGNGALMAIVLTSFGGLGALQAAVVSTQGAQSASYFQVFPPTASLDGLTIAAFVVQGLFFAASPTGGEGFTAQRFLAAKNEAHAQVGQLLNMVLTLVLRVVPFLVLGMAAAALYGAGDLQEPGEAWARIVDAFAPEGLKGLLVAGSIAAYMSTISTEMNWGASYVVNDLYRPLLRTDGSASHYVLVGRACSLGLFAISLGVSVWLVEGLRAWFLFINSVVFAFVLPLSWLRFFWWRLNIFGEAAALAIGLPLSYWVWFGLGFSDENAHPFWHGFLLLFGLGAIVIVATTLMTRPESDRTLERFYRTCRPPGAWGPIARKLDDREKKAIRSETCSDIVDCTLGVAFASTSILALIGLLAGRPYVAIAACAAAFSSACWFVRRWSRRGVFLRLRETGSAES